MADDWWQRFAQAVVNDECLPCPECDHRHDCWICQAAERHPCKVEEDQA